MKRVALYFGSFNPIHKGHIALAEWVVEQGLCDELIFIVSPQNPLKEQKELAPEFSRYEMCEMACQASRYPDRIKVSAVEFVLEKPSYTINTLRYLRENFGAEMQFSILLGADNVSTRRFCATIRYWSIRVRAIRWRSLPTRLLF